MKKETKYKLGAALSAAAAIVCATPAMAGEEMTATYRSLDYDSGNDANQYGLGLQSGRDWARFGGEFEFTDRKFDGDNALGAINGGINLAGPLDVTVKPRVEVGYRYQNEGKDDVFWGVGVTAQRQIVGPIDGIVSYRIRDSLSNSDYKSSRWTAGVSVALTDRINGGVNWLQDDEADYEGFGVSLKLEM